MHRRGQVFRRDLQPDRPRPFRVPLVWAVAPVGALACVYTMAGLPAEAWLRFAVWLVIGFAIYFFYSRTHSRLQAGR